MGVVTLIYDFPSDAPASGTVSATWTLPSEVRDSIIFLKSYETTFTGPGHGCHNATLSSPRFTDWHINAVRYSASALASTPGHYIDLRWDGVSQTAGGDVHMLVGRGDEHGSTGFTVTITYTQDSSLIKWRDPTASSTVVSVPAASSDRRPHFLKLVLEYNLEEFL